jgi:hypothetical protein
MVKGTVPPFNGPAPLGSGARGVTRRARGKESVGRGATRAGVRQG